MAGFDWGAFATGFLQQKVKNIREAKEDAKSIDKVDHTAQERARTKAWVLKYTRPCPSCKRSLITQIFLGSSRKREKYLTNIF